VRAGVNRGHLSFKVARVKSKAQKSDPKDNLPDFEQSLTELEALVAKLEQGDVPLEEALKTFERGVALTRQCQTALRTAQQKVEILLTRNGEENVEPFFDEAGEDDEEDLDDSGR
jgi:exodeoxyribonuclease VII small subunit